MGDSVHSSEFGKSSKRASVIPETNLSKSRLIVSTHKASSEPSFRRIASISHLKSGNGAVFGNAALFLLKIAALETVRRLSKAKCPFVWRGLQALQVLCYPPFKWIQRFSPFKGLVMGIQTVSRPLLVLSMATAFAEEADSNDGTSGGANETNECCPDMVSEIPSVQTTLERRLPHKCPQTVASELIQLQKELESKRLVCQKGDLTISLVKEKVELLRTRLQCFVLSLIKEGTKTCHNILIRGATHGFIFTLKRRTCRKTN